MAVNWTPAFNSTEVVHYNVSYIIANQPVQMTTSTVWIVFALVGISLLIISVMNIEETCNDLSGLMATIFLFVSAIQAFAVDTVTGFGVTSVVNPGNVNEFVLMENHSIYHYDIWGVALGILFVISMANLYRLWLDYHRITDQATPVVDRRDKQPAPSSPSSRKKQTDENDNDI